MNYKDKLNHRLFFLCFLISVLFSSCSEQVKKRDQKLPEFTIDLSEFQPASSFYIDDLIDSIHFILLETTPENIFGTISDIKISNNQIFILDKKNTKAIYAFTVDGDFSFKLSRHGRGPGEYYEITDFFLEGDKIEIYDSKMGKLITYNSKGDFVNERNVGFLGTSSVKIHPNFYLFNTSFISNEVERYPRHGLIATDSLGHVKYLAREDTSKIRKLDHMKEEVFFSSGRSTLYSPEFSIKVFHVDTFGISNYINFKLGKYQLDIEKLKGNNIEKIFNQLAIHEIRKVMETKHYIMVEFLFMRNAGYCLFDKITGTILRMGVGYTKGINTSYLPVIPLTTEQNRFVSAIDANEIVSIFDEHRHEFEKLSIYKQLGKENIAQLKLTDNPIIVTYKLKE